jgi:very-short-patch-repair endonuclease
VIQHGVFTLEQLRTLGLTASAVRKRKATGRLHRVHRGVYSLAPSELLSARGRYMSAVLACGPGAVLSHRSAADLLDLRRTDRRRIDVTIPGRERRRVAGIDVHRSQTLTTADFTTVDGIPCTTIPRTIVDLGAVLPTRAVERAIEQADVLEVLDYRKLDAVRKRNRHTRAAKRMASILADHTTAAPTESDLEELLLARLRQAGLPAPQRQLYIDPGDGEQPIRADFAWRDQRLVVEADSSRYHSTRRAFEGDRRRDQRLMIAGWRVIRITWRQLRDEPQRLVALIAAALSQPA